VSTAIFKAMLLGLVRDRGALLMSFVLPAIFFVIMAEIFTATSSGDLDLTMAVLDEVDTEASRRLLEALDATDIVTVQPASPRSRDGVNALVKSGKADIGLIVRTDADSIEAPTGFGPAPLLIVSDPSRAALEPIVGGLVRRVYFSALPDIALGNVVMELENQFITLTPTQRDDLDEGLNDLRTDTDDGVDAGFAFEDLMETESVVGPGSVNLVAYSAGAVAFMFLLFSSAQGAMTLLDEKDSGIIDRVLAGPGGMGVLVDGKFAYVIAQGVVQVAIIFIVAWLFYGVDLPARIAAWVVVTATAALAAAGLAMLLAAACQTRRQALAISNAVILVLSAIGGSMVPRFFMPAIFQDFGWLTPNTWALEAYSGIFWRGESIAELWLPLSLLGLTGIAGWQCARLIASRRAYAD
jgi:ABC-2 type transport system permease protein